jgi:hypothetical protein
MKKIFVLDAGFVYIGEGAAINDPLLGESIIIKKASNIRRYGTNKGLGQLAIEGKKESTELDYFGTITVPKSKVQHIIEISQKALDTYDR